MTNATLDLLLKRRSVKALDGPGPTPEELDRILTIAARVPDHKQLVPWRFIVFEGDARRRFGDVLAQVITQELYPQFINTIRELAGGALIMLPSSAADLEDPELRRIIAKTQVSPAMNWDEVCAHIADATPWWEPDTTHGYHVNTFGFLVGEVVRRVSGESVGAFFRSQIAVPLDADFHFGVST